MKDKSCNAIVDRQRIAVLDEQLITEYQQMRDERAQIHEWEWDNDFDFTILGLMELYSSYVEGYASQIATQGCVINPRGALKVLSESRLFDKQYFADWYFSADKKYVKVKKYIEGLDYLRMLAHEYISLYQNEASPLTDSVPMTQIHPRQQVDLLDIVPIEISNSPLLSPVTESASEPERLLVPA
jgi:hypothetical protein